MTESDTRLKILVVDDEGNIRKTLAYCLGSLGHKVTCAKSVSEAKAEASRRCFDMALVDMKLGEEDGLSLIPVLTGLTPWIKIVIITAHGSIETAIEAIRRGAADYVVKPFTPDQIKSLTRHIAKIRRMETEISVLRDGMEQDDSPDRFKTGNPIMRGVVDTIHKAAPTNATILLRGESGTGKSLLARLIHALSPRSGMNMETVACPSMPPDLLEGELFGYLKGAFTGAIRDYPGKIASCEGGTLFLDEIGEMSPQVQAKLLHFLQEKEYGRLGESGSIKADVRIIAATNADIEARVAAMTFREDLFYRLNVITVTVPPLRKRREDIVFLARRFLHHFCRVNRKSISGFTSEAVAAMECNPWPGNVRELRNAVERAVILGEGGEIGLSDLPGFGPGPSREISVGDPVTISVLEEQHIRKVVDSAPSLQRAAEILGVDQATLWRRRKIYGI